MYAVRPWPGGHSFVWEAPPAPQEIVKEQPLPGWELQFPFGPRLSGYFRQFTCAKLGTLPTPCPKPYLQKMTILIFSKTRTEPVTSDGTKKPSTNHSHPYPPRPNPTSFPMLHFLVVVVQSLSHVRLLRSHGLQPVRLLHPCDSPGKNTGVGCHLEDPAKEYG